MSDLSSSTTGRQIDSGIPKSERPFPGEFGSSCDEPATGRSSLPIAFGEASFHDKAREARHKSGWGLQFVPKLADTDGEKLYRRICEDIKAELRVAESFLVDDKLADQGYGSVAEINGHLERLYDCPWGEGESLKGVVVAIQSQTNNADWTSRHLQFLKDAIAFLLVRYTVTDDVTQKILDMVQDHELDVFRGTVSETDVRVRYRLEKEEQA